jgi:hypothetical protein
VVEAKFLASLDEIDAAYAAEVKRAGCRECGGALDVANYPRKPRGELGEAGPAYEMRRSFCCRCEGCRQRATPPSLRFLGRKVYFSVLVIVASASGLAMGGAGEKIAGRVHGVPGRTVRRWVSWWRTVFALSAFWAEAKAFFATPVNVASLPASLLARFEGPETTAMEKMLRFLAPITTTSWKARNAMGR